MNMSWLRNRITGHLLWRNPDLGVVTGGVLVAFLGVGTILPVLTIFAQERGLSIADIGIATSAYMLASFLCQFPMGWLSDRIGRKPLLIAGLSLHAVISLLYLGTDGRDMLILLRFLDGVSSGATWPAARAYVMDRAAPEQRGQALGYLSAAMNSGFLIGPVIGGVLGGVLGFAGPFWFGAVTSVIAVGFLAVTIHERAHRRAAAAAAAAAVDAGVIEERLQWRAVLPSVFMAAGGGVANGLFGVIWNIFMHDLGANLDLIGASYMVFAIPLLIVAPWAGRLADRRSRVPMILVPALVNGGVYLAYGLITSIPIILLLGVLEGTMVAFMGPALDSYFADVVPSRLRGRVQGVTNSTNTAVGFVMATAGAVLYGISPFWAFLTLALATVGAGLPAALLMIPHEARLRPRRPATPPTASETREPELSPAA